jgi:hypothetical protein
MIFLETRSHGMFSDDGNVGHTDTYIIIGVLVMGKACIQVWSWYMIY